MKSRGFWARVVALAVLAGTGACNLDEVDIPDFTGPAELGLSVSMAAIPDVLTADGFSSSVIQAQLRDQNGQPVVGRPILFAITDESGRFADIGSLFATNGQLLGGGTATAVSDGTGIAQVVYRGPPRTDATANQSVIVNARPVGTDFNGQIYRTVRIELRSAEPRLFPQNPTNVGPNCSFIVEVPNGLRANVTILFQTTSSDPNGTIVRYEWDFGDGTPTDYHPDTVHVFRRAGSYPVFHRVTDDDGATNTCTVTLNIQ